MSEFKVEVIKLGKIGKHPNADSLSITSVYKYPCIFRTGDFKSGDLAVYVPIDSLVNIEKEEFKFLTDKNRPNKKRIRIKARKIRGIFSMGLLVPANDLSFVLGQNVQKEYDIEKWEPENPEKDELEKDYGYMPIYDIEGLRRYDDILQKGEEVVITEKIHGKNVRFVFTNNQLWVGSHRKIKREGSSDFWQIAKEYKLHDKLSRGCEDLVVYGEIYGAKIQKGYDYGLNKPELIIFDIMNVHTKLFLDYDEFEKKVKEIDLPTVLVLYRGPWDKELVSLAEGDSIMPNAKHLREGIVIKPTKERWDSRICRVILKYAGEGYLLDKNS